MNPNKTDEIIFVVVATANEIISEANTEIEQIRSQVQCGTFVVLKEIPKKIAFLTQIHLNAVHLRKRRNH